MFILYEFLILSPVLAERRVGKIGKVGYEISFNRYFYKFVPPRPLEEIDADLKKLGKEIIDLLGEITE